MKLRNEPIEIDITHLRDSAKMQETIDLLWELGFIINSKEGIPVATHRIVFTEQLEDEVCLYEIESGHIFITD